MSALCTWQLSAFSNAPAAYLRHGTYQTSWSRSVSCAAAKQHPRMPKPPKSTKKPPTNIADKEGSPFHELGLKEIMEGMGRVRVRQHVNPLALQFQQPTQPVDWSTVYSDPSRPLYVDMGCGPGRFLLLLCQHHSRQQSPRQGPWNYLGLEIRQPLVDRANKWCHQLDLQGQVHFIFTNVSVALPELLKTYPGPLIGMSAQFPDPLFKKRHQKRRMVQPAVVQVARERLAPGGLVFLQSDVLDAIAAMRDEFEQHAGDVLQLSPLHNPADVFHWSREQEFQAAAAAAAGDEGGTMQTRSAESSCEADDIHDTNGGVDADGAQGFQSSWSAGGWLTQNPLGVPTEREHYVLSQGGKVFRVLLSKKTDAASVLDGC